MTVKAHVDALTALLAPTVTVYVTRAAETATAPYVVLHPDTGRTESHRLDLRTDQRYWRFQTTVAATGWEQATVWAQKVETALLDVVPAVVGSKCSPIRKETGVPLERDEDMPTFIIMARDIWTYSSLSA